MKLPGKQKLRLSHKTMRSHKSLGLAEPPKTLEDCGRSATWRNRSGKGTTGWNGKYHMASHDFKVPTCPMEDWNPLGDLQKSYFPIVRHLKLNCRAVSHCLSHMQNYLDLLVSSRRLSFKNIQGVFHSVWEDLVKRAEVCLVETS